MKNRTISDVSSHAHLLNQFKTLQSDSDERCKLYIACQYVMGELFLAAKNEKINKEIAVIYIKYILQRVTDMKMLEIYLLNAREIFKYEKNHSMQELIEDLLFQIKNQEFLLKINDSKVIQNDIDKGVLISGKPSKFSSRYMDYLLNKPNPYNNPADPDHKLLSTAWSRIDFEKDLSIVYVEGDSSNPYGHSILKLGKYGYIHVNTLHGEPQYIPNDKHFAAYCAAQGGHVLKVQPLHLPRHEEAKIILKKQAEEPWLWKMTHHNCLSFIHKIALAGGISLDELGYKNNDIHSPAKYPRVFMNSVQEVKRNYDDYKPGPYNAGKKFDAYFLKNSNLTPERRKKAIEYYNFLCSKGLKEKDVLEYVSLAYDLHVHHSILKKFSSKMESVCHVPKAIGDNMSALGKVAVTGIFGRKNTIKNEKENDKPRLTRSHSFSK